ncbi:MAG: RNA polymerase sigma factor [Planctomycetota bacterium]
MASPVTHKTQELLALAKQGDGFALGQLCDAYAERVRRIVRLRMSPELRSQVDSMDLVQDTLLMAVRDLDDFTCHNDGDFLRWLLSVAENRIHDNVDRFHAQKRDIRRQVSLERLAEHATSLERHGGFPLAATTPSVVLARREDLDRLEQAMDRIKPEYRKVIMLAKIEGLSHKDIGARLGKSPAAVAMLLSRAIVALSNAFGQV